MKIKVIVAFPASAEELEKRADVLQAYVADGVRVECSAVRNSGTTMDSDYESLLFDAYITEAGLHAEDEGFDAVVVDTVSDAGLYALRSRLSVPVVGPGLAGYQLACTLGRRFSIVTPWHRWRYLHERTLDLYSLDARCASIRSLDAAVPSPSVAGLTAIAARAAMESDPNYYATLLQVAESCVDDDGADVIVLGSATMDSSCDYLRRRMAVPVVNPGPASVKLAEQLVALGVAQSKAAFPAPETLQDAKFSAFPSMNPEQD